METKQIEDAKKQLSELDKPKNASNNGFMQRFKTKTKKKKMGISERAEAKFATEAVSDKTEDTEALRKKEIDEILDNPLSQLYAQKHPEEIARSKEY